MYKYTNMCEMYTNVYTLNVFRVMFLIAQELLTSMQC